MNETNDESIRNQSKTDDNEIMPNNVVEEKGETEKEDAKEEKKILEVVEVTKYDSNENPATIPATLQERFSRIKQMVKDAIAAKHTFMIYGRSRLIRECLLKRGWCEKYYRKNNPDQNMSVDSSPVALLSGIGDLKDLQSERLLISRMLGNHTVDFLWNTGSDWPGWPSQDNKSTIFNRFCRAGFTSKVGLCSNVRQMHWYYEPGVANTLFPRCYNLCQSDQMHAFVEDFRLTACLSLLKWLVDKVNEEGENAARSPTGTIPLKALDFAIRRCSDYIGAQSHEDIDQDIERVWSHQWDQFISWYYKIVQGEALFIRNNLPFHKYFLASRHILKKMKKFCPQLDMDGIMNVWILKPGNKSRGRGIVLMNKIEDVMAKMNPANKTDTRYVVQKYIEKPLLIYNTKFDIRQWFIVTCAQPLTLWMYRESYLRFCSQKFSLSDFHESIHLCNNAVQCKYKNCPDRDPALPADNMWDATTFKEYLRSQGHPNVWEESIYPGMKQGLVGSLLASQEAMDRRRNSFELYGADFMVMEDFSIWLIEINSHPDMSYSTSVTQRLCRQVMEDTVRVVIDFREDKSADTGQFELAYRQRMPSCHPYLGAALSLQGTRIQANEKKFNIGDSKHLMLPKSPTSFGKKKSRIHSNIGPLIVDVIEELELQLDQEFYAYYKLESPNIRQSLPIADSSNPRANSGSPDKMETKSIQVVPSSTSTDLVVKPKTESQGNPVKVVTTNSKSPSSRRKIRSVSHQEKTKQPVVPRSALVPKNIADFEHQRSSSSSAPKVDRIKRHEEKIISTAMKEAAKKYKRSVAGITSEMKTTLPSVLSPKKLTRSSKKSSKAIPKKSLQTHKHQILSDITDMYAVGLRIK